MEETKIFPLIKLLASRLSDELFQTYWPDFKPFPFAFFTREKVYLKNHPEPPTEFECKNGIFVGKWSEQFNGNTAITLNGYPTAIWDVSTISPDMTFEKLYSLIVHEMYHAFQTKINYNRSAKESLYFHYPQSIENITYRILERKALHHALFAEDIVTKQNYANVFFYFREQRHSIILDYLNYELGQESYEGLAQYVEAKALMSESSKPPLSHLSELSNELVRPTDTLYELRKSCYSSGMAIAFLLDSISPNWQEEYIQTEDYLYTFLRKKIKKKTTFEQSKQNITEYGINSIIVHPHKKQDEQTIASAKLIFEKTKKKQLYDFQQFYHNEGYLIKIVGNINITGFDPMNLLPKEQQLLHKRMLIFTINKQRYFLMQPILTTLTGNDLQCKEMYYYSKTKPIENGKNIKLEELGEITGKLIQKGKQATIILDN
ncbi:hypothetical protein [Bacillus kwashiorkori]|uniref:hypothetical protein n=1 Tax=Bacillus kwashiorkori TaxID=1522318 RepID=UPI0007858119|nr:hypothetical protein [Bacillus kwashiorkori]